MFSARVPAGLTPNRITAALRSLRAAGEPLVDEIVALAEANGVPIEHDPALAMALSHLEVGQAIPPALYTAIAELLVFLYELDAQQAGGAATVGAAVDSDPDAPLSALLSSVS